MSTFVCLFQVLDLLWSLSHLPSLTTDMVDQALKSHIEILSDSYAVKEQIKKNYAVKCVEDIRKGVLIVPAIRQLLKITRGMVKQQFNKHDKVGTWLKKKILITFFFGGGDGRGQQELEIIELIFLDCFVQLYVYNYNQLWSDCALFQVLKPKNYFVRWKNIVHWIEYSSFNQC